MLGSPVQGINGPGSDVQIEPGRNMNISDVSSAYFQCTNESAYTGMAVTNAGDLNGDGTNDFAISATGNSEGGYGAGKVFIQFGRPGGWVGFQNLSHSEASYIGETSYDSAGTTLASLGDVNGDGFDDLAIGTVNHDGGGQLNTGKVYIIFGKAVGWEKNVPLANSDASIVGQESMHYIGISVSSAGDVNGDGFDDILLGSFKSKAYLFMGKEEGWSNPIGVSNADTIFQSATGYDYMGETVSGGGDLNGDGFDDIVISATRNSEFTSYAGKVYVYFGGSEGFDETVSPASADATYFGEGISNMTGKVLKSDGDVNSDGFDDILISSIYYGIGGYGRGKTYLVLGKSEGWETGVNLVDADASWIGENGGDYSGYALSFVDDYNADGYGDLMISAYTYSQDGIRPGKVYFIPGRVQGWETNVSLSSIDVSMIGESDYDCFGKSMIGVGDVTGDARPDVLISSYLNDENGPNTGKVYLVQSLRNYEPEEVYRVSLYNDPFFTIVPEYVDRGDLIYLQLTGRDANNTHIDATQVTVTFEKAPRYTQKVNLRETGMDTGIYRNSIRVPFDVDLKTNVTSTSFIDPSKTVTVMVHTPILITPREVSGDAVQGEEFSLKFHNFGYASQLQWTLTKDADWLFLYSSTGEIKGVPENKDVGKWNLKMGLSDGKGHTDSVEFNVKVRNADPVIENHDIITALQDTYYYVDYECNEDYTGMTSWHYMSDAKWLSLNEDTGELFGTPTNDDVGEYAVSVWVLDGNDGRGTRDFTLTVQNRNDPPMIVTEDVTQLDQGDNFRRDYEVEDIDRNDVHTWTVDTDASWLSMESETGILKGKPGPLDVGSYSVKVTVTDSGGATDSHQFTLVVHNVNDPPVFTDVPFNADIPHGGIFTYDVAGTDIDGNDGLEYSITTKPETDMTIDPDTGRIYWKASIDWFTKGNYVLDVKVSLSDGEYRIDHEFDITVKPSVPPSARLILPEDKAKISRTSAVLSWSGFDLEGDDITYDVYVGQTKAFVESRKEETIYLKDYQGTEVGLEGLVTGKTYFWMVIPFDGCSYGTCSPGILSFTLNNPPTIKDVSMQEAEAGKVFKLLLIGQDEDDERNDLMFQLVEGPNGLDFDPATGLIKWKPEMDDVMLHQARFTISDGIDTTEFMVTIDVIEPEGGIGAEGGMTMVLVGAGIGAVVLLVSVTVFFVIYRKKNGKKGDGEATLDTTFSDEGPDEEENIPVSSRYSAVTIDATEAHMRDKMQHKVTYESLYGKTRPEAEDEGMTARELKEFIGKQITELERLEE
ncbi:MAG: putative Ig domain-containing protein [Thermoplasmatota archaeon]